MSEVLDGCGVDVRDAERQLHERVNDLLSRWHAWCAGHGYGMGYPSRSASCREARASRQHDDENGGLDAHIDAVLLEGVDAVVGQIAQPWCTALQIQARNLYTGRSVWLSPRLPACASDRAELLAVARKKFVDGLDRAGLL